MKKITALTAGILVINALLSSSRSTERFAGGLNNTCPSLDLDITQQPASATINADEPFFGPPVISDKTFTRESDLSQTISTLCSRLPLG